MTIRLVQCPACQAFAHFLLAGRMHIERVASVGTYGHAGVRYLIHQAALAIAEPWPRRTIQAGELHVIERQLLVVPILAPTLHQELEELFVRILVVGIRFALIPDGTLDRILLQRKDARLIQIARLIRMALELVRRFLHVQGRTTTHPVLDEVILRPVAEDGREFVLQCTAVYPSFGRRATDGVANQAHRHLQAVL